MDEDTNERYGARKAFGRIPHKPEILANLARLIAEKKSKTKIINSSILFQISNFLFLNFQIFIQKFKNFNCQICITCKDTFGATVSFNKLPILCIPEEI